MLTPTFDDTLPPWQFRLTATAGGFDLATGPEIETVELRDATGAYQGHVFGFPIDLEGKRLLKSHTPHTLSQTRGDDVDAFAEAVLDAIGGRYIWLFVTDGVSRIYLDCAGLVPVVYDAEAKVAGTTATAFLDDAAYEDRFDHPLYDRLRIAKDGFFPAGFTAHTGVTRLLPNHYLDLTTWTPHRHWPHGPLEQVADPDAAIARIVEILRIQLEAFLADDLRVAQALTAGHETRMLLAVARPYVKDIDFVTVVGADRHAVDSVMASKIAAAEGLNHRKLERRTATDEQRALFVRRGGNCVVDSNSLYAPSVAPIADTHNFVGGLGGELARAFFWQNSDTPDLEITPERLLNRFGQPQEERLLGPLTDWLAELPTTNAHDILDLAYVEHRMGPWSGGQFCNDPTLVRYAPLFTREASRLMLGLPPEWKREERMSGVALAQTWPELARFPYNHAGWWLGFSAKARRVLADPGVILRRLRKMRK